MPERIETVDPSSITVGEARKSALKNAQVARIAKILFEGSPMALKGKDVTKIMLGEGYSGWRALNMLIVSRDISEYEDHLSGNVNDINPNSYPDDEKPHSQKDFYLQAAGACLLDRTGNALAILHELTTNPKLSALELERINEGRFEYWIPTFALTRARWARDTEDGLELTEEGLDTAIDFGIAGGFEEESERRRFKRNLWNISNEGNEELLELKGNLWRLAAIQARNAIPKEKLTPNSLEEINVSELRNLLVSDYLHYLYSHLVDLDQNSESRKSYFAEIRALEDIATFSEPEQFESKLEELGRQKYTQILEGNPSESAIDDQIRVIEETYECLKFPWKVSEPRKFSALQRIQQKLSIPFWSNDWKFSTGINSMYKPDHTADSPDEQKITIGTFVRLNPLLRTGGRSRADFEKEWEVVDIQQGLMSGLLANYQFVYVKDKQNWITSLYLTNFVRA